MPAIDVVRYTPSELQSWDIALKNNQALILNHTNRINQYQLVLTPLEEELQRIGQTINEILAALNVDTGVSLDVSAYLNPNYHPPRHGDHNTNYRIIDLQRQLTSLDQQRKDRVNDMLPYQNNIRRLTQDLNKLISQNELIQQRIESANLFLHVLCSNPRALVMELRDKLLAAVNAYEDKHMSNQSLAVRSSLHAIHNGLDLLIADVNDLRVQQQNYLRLCGFLADIYSRVQQENKDDVFLSTLEEVINTTHIDPREDLLDDLGISFNAMAWFRATKKEQRRILAITESELNSEEVARCQQMMDRLLDNSLPQATYLQQSIRQSAQAIDIEICEKIRRNESIDYHFYICLANTLMQLHHDGSNSRAAGRLFHMAEQATGASSLGKKLLGALMVVLGAVMITTSVLAFASSLGSTSALSIWGSALGLNLIQTQVAALSLSCSITAAVGTGLTFWGSRTIGASTRQGLSQDLMETYDAVLKDIGPTAPLADEQPSYYAQPMYH
ncbi:MAG: hypothetical protein P4L79_00700 [Legionella sp.]|uniref:hypothetical protein n=1 Tax=Legionella sp. TaxID=459 RepID=UPI00283D4215|nr:hypothetical protein [Legionella sp.]